ncbi:unnamed protein product [Dicrocoelium dendriticum]|nr:unnamed protein product [Dicrocoelium dendriticum]
MSVEFPIGSKMKYRNYQRAPTSGPWAKKKGPYDVVYRRDPVYTIARQGDSRRVHSSALENWQELEEEPFSHSEHQRQSEILQAKAAGESNSEGVECGGLKADTIAPVRTSVAHGC